MMRRLWRQPLDHAASYLVLIAMAVILTLPFFWMLSTACKPTRELSQVPVRWVPENPSCIQNLQQLYRDAPHFNRYFGNTAIVTVARVVGQLLFCALAAYGFARFRFPGRAIVFALILAILMVPYQAIVIPQFVLVKEMGLRNSLLGVIMPNLFSAFTLFLLRQAFLQVPMEIEEAAEIDGANPLQIFWHVSLPLIGPSLAAATVIGVQAAWNDFLWPLVIANTNASRVLTVGISLLQTDRENTANVIMMASLVATIPMMVIFVLLQRFFVRGVASAGLKG